MELAASLLPYIWLPTAAFLDHSTAQVQNDHAPSLKDRNISAQHWDSSRLNPRNLVNTLKSSPNSGWRIDGCDGQGTQFFALPTFLMPGLAPLRIDVFIPDQSRHPNPLRHTLGSAAAFSIRDRRVAVLGISELIVEGLNRFSADRKAFEGAFRALPFGSRIVFDEISYDLSRMKIHMIPDLNTERQLLSRKELQSMWLLPESSWPPSLDLDRLEHHRQLNDTISLVQIPDLSGSQLVVFKSSVNQVKYLYHELKLLLTISPHPHIIARPLYLVTRRDRYGGDNKVYGFILEYYAGGDLADELELRAKRGVLNLKDQLRWAHQITSTLMFIMKSPAKFYSELKTDNFLLSNSGKDVIFIDFEQMGNWTSMSAPEVHNLEYLRRLARSEIIPEAQRLKFANFVAKYLPDHTQSGPVHSYADEGYYAEWTILNQAEREAAMVFSLGKLLWCIFEGSSCPRNSVLREPKEECVLEFPEFRRTPVQIQRLIRRCTIGSVDWEGPRLDIVRRGSKIYPRGRSGVNGEPVASAHETMEAAKIMWQEKVRDARLFLEVKDRWQKGANHDGDEMLLGYPLRPKLCEVLATIVQEQQSGVSAKP